MTVRQDAEEHRTPAIRLTVHPRHPAREAVERAARSLAKGGVAVFPTETLYGMGGMHSSEAAARRVRVIKRLDPESPLLLLAPDLDWVFRLSARSADPAVRGRTRALMERFWPGPLTLILPASPAAPPWIVPAAGGIALRVPGPSAAAALAAVLGAPIVATSANRHGEAPAASGAEAFDALGTEVDVVLDGGVLAGENPSTLLDLTGAEPRLVREGAIRAAELKDFMTPSVPKHAARARAAERKPGAHGQVLFVCSGNTCRSPLAAAILRDLLPAGLRDVIDVVSAGSSAISGAPASDGSLRVAEANGLSLAEHRSRRLTRELIQESDLILVMEAHHRAAVLALDPAAGERTHLLLGLSAGRPPGEGAGVADPMGGADRAYDATHRDLREAIRRALPVIRSVAGGGS